MRSRFLDNDNLDVILVGINIWTADGKLVYTDQLDFLRRRYDLSPEQLRVLAEGGTGEAILGADIAAANPPLGRGAEAPVQIFTRVTSLTGTPLLFEGFYSLANLDERRAQIYTPFRWISLAGMGTLLILVTPIIWVLTRDIRRAGEERERLLQAGLDASDAERRRIARDLHDGVVQDLAGTSFTLAALARSDQLDTSARATMGHANDAVRDSLKALRALLAEIHPPEIHVAGLPSALADLIAPAAAQGVQASVSVAGIEHSTDEQASLVLRVAQEAVRNTLRHAQSTTLTVSVHGDGKMLILDVVDDGRGFEPTAPRAVDQYGLKGMSSLVRDRGGSVSVDSAPGRGTKVRLEVQMA